MSRFLQDSDFKEESIHQEIDFDDAIKLPEGGTTCDIYRTRWQRREVFVKRLKEEYRANPLYLDALDKEYEIGITLKHSSLPDYRAFHRDYLVLDYIDGETLADMIKKNDPWLRSEKNILRLLRELVNVVDYLHRHNVTHCDIKPDNIMITANNHNMVLIDFDKCYTDSLNDTSGDPSKYGLTFKEQGRTAIDFHGIGRTIQILQENVSGFRFRRYREFVKACQVKDCTPETLLEILDYKPSSAGLRYKSFINGVMVLVVIGFFFFWFFYEGKQEITNENSTDIPVIIQDDTIVRPEERKVELETKKETSKEAQKEETNAPLVGKTQEQLHYEAQLRAAQLDKRIQPYYDELNAGIDSLVSFSNRTDITGGQLLERIRLHGDKEDEYFEETFAILDETFPGLTDRETMRVLAYSKAYTGYKRRAEPILRELGHKVEEFRN